uniref:Uncharacterized protein n=1 Tax=Rhizophagus irregularis (strain DAOM 181602 / DAOM 197198 / MUCL 43194) TaxID=747089 RepID=U9TRS8_RHIID
MWQETQAITSISYHTMDCITLKSYYHYRLRAITFYKSVTRSDLQNTKGYDQAIHRYCLDIRYVTVYLNTYGTLKELEMKNTPELSGKT